MSDEGNDKDVEPIKPDAEGKIAADKDGKYPDVVLWNKYVGVKESLGKRAREAEAKVASLEEQLKNAPKNSEEAEKLQKRLEEVEKERDDYKEKYESTNTELTTFKEKTLGEKRQTLISRGVPEEKAKAMDEKELDAAFSVLGSVKAGPDLGGGGGAPALTGSPYDLAQRAYSTSNK